MQRPAPDSADRLGMCEIGIFLLNRNAEGGGSWRDASRPGRRTRRVRGLAYEFLHCIDLPCITKRLFPLTLRLAVPDAN
jgi:hypothetical protein